MEQATSDLIAGALGALAGIAATYGALRAASARRSGGADRSDPAPSDPTEDGVARLVEALPFAAFTVDERARVRVFNARPARCSGWIARVPLAALSSR